MLTSLYHRAWQMQLGVTLVELMVALVVFSILVAVGAPNVMNWVQSAQIRTASESIENALQLARAEAVRRNSTAEFALCAGSSGDSTWDVLAASAPGVANACGSDSATGATGWVRVQNRSGSEGSANAIVTVTKKDGTVYDALTQPITYNGLGRITPLQSQSIYFDVTNPKGGNCMKQGGAMRCMRIVVSTGGQARMCNPAYSISSNPQGCP